ncbi:MAG: hypothetical protein R3F43_13275 [bacterium]
MQAVSPEVLALCRAAEPVRLDAEGVGTDNGQLEDTDVMSPACAPGRADGGEAVYSVEIAQPSLLVARATGLGRGTLGDPVISLRQSCESANSELACSTGMREPAEPGLLPQPRGAALPRRRGHLHPGGGWHRGRGSPRLPARRRGPPAGGPPRQRRLRRAAPPRLRRRRHRPRQREPGPGPTTWPAAWALAPRTPPSWSASTGPPACASTPLPRATPSPSAPTSWPAAATRWPRGLRLRPIRRCPPATGSSWWTARTPTPAAASS